MFCSSYQIAPIENEAFKIFTGNVFVSEIANGIGHFSALKNRSPPF
jgi:hypothetical protein